MSTGPVEAKVKAATGWAAATGFAVWLLSTYVFHGVVPAAVLDLLQVLVPAIGALLGGYLTRHTPRNDPDALAAYPPPRPT